MTITEEIAKICDGIKYREYDVPKEAKQLAKENNCIIVMGGSDDLMYCYGAECYLTDYEEHSIGWDGDTLIDIEDKQLENEAKQLGLRIYWCGKIEWNTKGYPKEELSIPNYNIKDNGGFFYKVNQNIEHSYFKVMDENEVYCTGIVIKLPENFKKYN